MPNDPVLCLGIDLDDLRHYRAIHGLPSRSDTPIVFEVAVPRFLEFCERVGLRATLFAIGEDLRWPEAREALRIAMARGHEIASHSYAHAYDLSRQDPSAIARDVRLARAALQDATGSAIRGFRAPGYNLSTTLLQTVAEVGHRYDASVLPSPAYYVARAAVLAGMGLRGRRSASIMGRASDFFSGGRPFTWPGIGLQEYPITACGPLRLPLIGTVLAKGGILAGHLVRSAARLPFVQVEFHALDFLDAEHDPIEPDLLVEPALRVPLDERLRRFDSAIRLLKAGRQVLRLVDL